MIKVLTYGTFDLLHYGHINILKNCKAMGDHLTVGLSTDRFNLIKGKTSVMSFEERKEILQNIKYVDNIIEENDWNQKIIDIKNNDIDIFIMGDDWKGKFDYLNEYCKVIYLPRTQFISTTLLKDIMYNKAL